MDQLEVCKHRRSIYELFSYSLLSVPTDDLLQTIIEGEELLKDLIEDYSDMDYSFENYNLEEYIQEYYDRFFVPTSSLFIPPYESAVRNKTVDRGKTKYGNLDGKETFHVKACYEMVSFKPDQLNMFKPLKDIQFADHIAFEMAFMTYLVSKEEYSLENKEDDNAYRWRNLQSEFLQDHLSKWIMDFASLSEEKGKGLYSYLLKLCAAWVEEDNNFLVKELAS